MQEIKFPVNFQFKITSLANDFIATDASGKTIAYVRQKMFKLKEDIQIFSDDTKSKVIYSIKADRWLDFSAAYAFFDTDGKEFGKIARKGWKSLWKSEYDIIDENKKIQYTIREENGWVKVMDSLIGQIPIISMFTGYLFNPSYMMTNTGAKQILDLKNYHHFLDGISNYQN